ncbi:MAG: chromosomal replication initiator protein DnaA [Fibrobacteraceae bacterium]
MNPQWEKCLELLHGKVSDSVFNDLFSKLTLSSVSEHYCIVVIPQGKDPKAILPYKGLLELSWQEASGSHADFDFQRNASIIPNATPPRDIGKEIKLSKEFSFENFIVGDKSKLAFSAAFAVAENPSENKFNPLFIYGASGLGKTHLLQAIGNFILEGDSGKRVRYIPANDFQREYTESIRNGNTNEWSSFYRNEVDVLLIDDIQNWSGSTETQNEFFHIFNTLHQAGKQIVLTSDAPAAEVKSLSDRLVSRFSSGLTVDIQPPSLETREAILRKKAANSQLEISDDVFAYLAENIEGSVRPLDAVIVRLTMQSTMLKQDIDINLARKVVADIIPNIKRRVGMETVIHAVSQFFEVPEDKLLETGRGTKEVAHARQVAMYLMKSLTTLSLKSVGMRFGNRDHSTVVHAIKTIEKEMQEDPAFSRTIETLKSNIH